MFDPDKDRRLGITGGPTAPKKDPTSFRGLVLLSVAIAVGFILTVVVINALTGPRVPGPDPEPPGGGVVSTSPENPTGTGPDVGSTPTASTPTKDEAQARLSDIVGAYFIQRDPAGATLEFRDFQAKYPECSMFLANAGTAAAEDDLTKDIRTVKQQARDEAPLGDPILAVEVIRISPDEVGAYVLGVSCPKEGQ